MSVVEQYILPIIKVMFIFLFVGLSCFGFYKIIRMYLPKELNSFFKFKILRKSFPEEDVQWCLNAYERGADNVDIEKNLRINRVSGARVEDTLYIFKKITKLKGGLKSNDRQIKSSSLKTFPRRENKEKS